jgi:phage terminase small subunit
MGRKPGTGVVSNKLTARDFKFAQLVLSGVQPQQAAIECGYNANPDSAYRAGLRLMEKASIKAYIEQERQYAAEIRRKETEVDDIWITKKFKEILDRCMQAEPIMEFNRESGMMEQATDERTGRPLFKFDSMGAIKAAENLAKHIGYYELDNNQKKPIIQVGVVNQQNILNFFEEENDNGEISEAGDQG